MKKPGLHSPSLADTRNLQHEHQGSHPDAANYNARRLGCAAQRLLLGVKRTWRGLVSMSANDPKRTFRKDVATVGISEETTSQSGA